MRICIAASLFLASFSQCPTDPAPVIRYAPGENLERIDVALIERAEAAVAFKRNFDARYASGKALSAGAQH
jgi:hypothetical protein